MDWKLELLPIPVSDVERAKRFYSEQVGFTIDHDTKVSASTHLVQLTPHGSACSIVLGEGLAEMAPGTVRGVQLVVSDIEAARAELVERGVDATVVRRFVDGEWVDGRGDDRNAFVFFSDPDGNGWVLQERPSGPSEQ
jgi:predicted enzyme related to lactoylglutathione lyase